jgi:hypothetical protein
MALGLAIVKLPVRSIETICRYGTGPSGCAVRVGSRNQDARRSGGRCSNTISSWFVPIAFICFAAYFEQAAARLYYSVDFEAVIYATLNLTRASVPAAKVADTTGASSTQCCRHPSVESGADRNAMQPFVQFQP